MYLVRASDDFHTHRLTRHASRWDLTCAPALLCDCLMRDIHLAIIDPPSPSVPALPSMPALWQAGIPPQDPRAGSRQSAYLDVRPGGQTAGCARRRRSADDGRHWRSQSCEKQGRPHGLLSENLTINFVVLLGEGSFVLHSQRSTRYDRTVRVVL